MNRLIVAVLVIIALLVVVVVLVLLLDRTGGATPHGMGDMTASLTR
jgi:hypothetical protein